MMTAMERIESRGRSRALQVLYAWDLRRGEALDGVAARIWDDLAVPPDERAFADALLHIVATEGPDIDADLGDITTNWRLDRLGVIERCALRLGAAELRARQTPPRVVIQECVRLAERFGSATAARFVNGVLDALARRLGTLR